ncbi:MAG: hypothetical protein AAGK21_07130 [Bacteroidota bacterium]
MNPSDVSPPTQTYSVEEVMPALIGGPLLLGMALWLVIDPTAMEGAYTGGRHGAIKAMLAWLWSLGGWGAAIMAALGAWLSIIGYRRYRIFSAEEAAAAEAKG